eukprot:CAMPEP_0118983656 /NCGR_PEP_ID=MMETSP1173-20130426/35998_1 /TAXON_ID=1034831 /ORGANISM="Rhizochromulina marina cf, Strain CCMP1243" /LENGTH=114 /DNA_ID=CAMNT_0006934253 /DNA_START=244 /DNA_END=584 /DNA_ORIENTATION=+
MARPRVKVPVTVRPSYQLVLYSGGLRMEEGPPRQNPRHLVVAMCHAARRPKLRQLGHELPMLLLSPQCCPPAPLSHGDRPQIGAWMGRSLPPPHSPKILLVRPCLVELFQVARR